MNVITETDLTCPECQFMEWVTIPADVWLLAHVCARCGTQLRPFPDDCCVICSYTPTHCISKQLSAEQNR